jgi:uncharacterized membrane protein
MSSKGARIKPMKINKRILIQFSITIAFLSVLLYFINTRVDFETNSIFIDANLGDHYSDVEILLKRQAAGFHERIKPGDIKPALIDDLLGFEVNFLSQPLLGEDNFILTEQQESVNAQSEIEPVIEVDFALTNDPDLIKINSINFVHSYERLATHVRLVTLNPAEIDAAFRVDGCEKSEMSDESAFVIHGGVTTACRLVFHADIQLLTNRINRRIDQLTILANISAIVVSIAFYYVLSYIEKRLPNTSLALWRKLTFTTTIAILFFSLGVLLSVFANAPIDRTLLIVILVVFIVAIVLDRKRRTQVTDLAIDQEVSGLAKWDYVILISMLLISTIIFFFRLGRFDFYDDEFQVVDAAAGFLKTGQFARWGWITQAVYSPYSRAWPHTFLIAQSFRIFGISEWSARLPSVLFGLVFLMALFGVAKFFANKPVALLSFLSAAFIPWYVRTFRFTRMYALLIPLSLVSIYFLYRWIMGESQLNTGITRLDNLIKKYLNFDHKYLLIVLPLLYLNYLIHVNSLIILIALFIFICVMAILEKTKKFIVLSVSGIVLLPIAVIGFQLLTKGGVIDYSYTFMPRFLHFLTAFDMRRFEYIDYLLINPFGVLAGFSLIVYWAYILIKNEYGSRFFYKHLYLFVIVITSAIFFIFIADRVAWFFYILHITPLALILIISGFWHLTKTAFNKPFFPVAILVVVLGINFSKQVPNIYFGQNNNGVFSRAYQVIVENYDYESEVIFGQYLRTYYLQDLQQIRVVSLQNNQTYTFDQFLEDLEKYPQGWITWETKKSYHVADEIVFFVEDRFTKIHGAGIDDTHVEVYYYTWPDPIITTGQPE